MRTMLWVVWMATAALLPAAETIPVEDFARSPSVAQARLSPDGQYVAFLRESDGKDHLYLTSLADRKLARIEPADAKGLFQPREVTWFDWLNDRRLVFTTTVWENMVTGISAVDRDGRQWRTLSGVGATNRNAGHLDAVRVLRGLDDRDQSVLLLGQLRASGEWIVYPDVFKVNTLTGFFSAVAKNPGNVVAWGTDPAGSVRIGITVDGLKIGALYRESDDAPWRPLGPLDAARGRVRPLGFDTASSRLYIAALSAERRWAIYPYDPAGNSVGERLVGDAEYDILPEVSVPAFDGIPLARPVFARDRSKMIGAYYVTEGPMVRWLDPEYAGLQRSLDRALPGTFNLITSGSQDQQRLLVLAFSDRDPGTYYLYDRGNKSLTLVATRMAWIKPAQMAEMHPIKYAARDGVQIHGYFTAPPGGAPRHLPLVVLPHGGPWVRDAWGFDPLVQMLASRGYAVLQMNYRGSPGYGEEFQAQGRREFGRAVQDDIEDGTRWAIAQGLADPKRIAIVGGSYGGYSALFALGHNPELYCCGVAIDGVTDWPAIFAKMADPEYKISRDFWSDQIGDPQTDEAGLQAISPVSFAARIVAPVLLIHGREDRLVPLQQAHAMVAALEKAGRPPETLFLADVGHRLHSQAARAEAYARIAAFLARHLNP